MSSHPVHIINAFGKLNPSAFIPFCQIGEHYFGLKIKPFSVPVCTGFEKIIFEGHLCYTLRMDKFETPKLNAGRKNGLKLIIDTNVDRESIRKKADSEVAIRLHINTVKPFTDSGGGQYIVTSVKQMSTTSDFDNFHENVKRCQNKETTEECARKKLIPAAAKQCGCLPASVNQLENIPQVNF